MFAALVLAAALVTPTPAAVPDQTPPPEPNHVTIEADESYLQAAGLSWRHWNGFVSQLSGRYEFQASTSLRFADTFHWERLSSAYTVNYAGQTITAPYSFNEWDDEFDIELGRPEIPTGVGVGYYDYNHVYEPWTTYNIAGFGVGIDRWANYYVPRSVYYSVWYYPDVRGAQPGSDAYGIARVDVGLNFRKSLVSPWSLRIGVQDESWFSRDPDDGNSNYLEPYVSLSYWR